ncbi:hypothetical protein CC78DRAFT_215755 [Lojkania enalia]|uniref:Polyprenal reductase n=1 Tax=Lojkania enalia TaxID=147567 RepID=A0A9P4N8I3_9PLEO|nr:hypothetical protein CC78DRAFT_215755 [Didymosphaeria enalia]
MHAVGLHDPVVLLRAFYLAAAILILVIQAIPALKTRFLSYGSRATPSSSKPPSPSLLKAPFSPLSHFLDSLAAIRVPHRLFTHFYVVSVACSVFWGLRLWRGAFRCGADSSYPFGKPGLRWMTDGQVQLVWLLMLLQGTRRLVESFMYTSSTKSQMWFGHYLLGLLFYVTVNVAIWAEGLPRHWEDVPSTCHPVHFTLPEELQRHWPKATTLLPAILTAHVLQHTYHEYLFCLRTEHSTYQLPAHPMFPNLLCPHYTCEIVIYILLSFLAAPIGQTINWTLMAATVFVAVNLAVTAASTREWYIERFGPENVKGRARIVPWVW